MLVIVIVWPVLTRAQDTDGKLATEQKQHFEALKAAHRLLPG